MSANGGGYARGTRRRSNQQPPLRAKPKRQAFRRNAARTILPRPLRLAPRFAYGLDHYHPPAERRAGWPQKRGETVFSSLFNSRLYFSLSPRLRRRGSLEVPVLDPTRAATGIPSHLHSDARLRDIQTFCKYRLLYARRLRGHSSVRRRRGHATQAEFMANPRNLFVSRSDSGLSSIDTRLLHPPTPRENLVDLLSN